MSVNIRFEKDDLFRNVYFQHGTSLYKARQFADWLKNYTDAVITVVSVTETKVQTLGSIGSGPYASVDLYAKSLIRDDDGKTHEIIVPAPISNIFDTEQLIKTEFGEAYAARYSTLAGKTFTFTRGALCGVT